MASRAKSDMGFAPKSVGAVVGDNLTTSSSATENYDVPDRARAAVVASVFPDITALPNEMLVKDGVEYGGATGIEHDGTALHATKLVVGGGSAPASASLKVTGTTGQGLVIPTLTTAERVATSMDEGSLVFDSDESAIYFKAPSGWRKFNAKYPAFGAGPATDGSVVFLDKSSGEVVMRTADGFSWDATAQTLSIPAAQVNDKGVLGRTYALCTGVANEGTEVRAGSVPRTTVGDVTLTSLYASNNITVSGNQIVLPDYPAVYLLRLRAEGYISSAGGYSYDDAGVGVYRMLSGVETTIAQPTVYIREGSGYKAPMVVTSVRTFEVSTGLEQRTIYFKYLYTRPEIEEVSDKIFYTMMEFELDLLEERF
jgi:hypothetical protein